MSTTNVQAIEDMYKAAAQGDIQKALSHLDPNIVVHEQESLPYGGEYRGHDGYQRLFKNLMGVWDNFQFTPKQLLDAGDHVVAVVGLEGKAKSTGKTLDMDMYELWRMQNGKAIECHSIVYDTAKMLQLLN